MDTLCHRCGGDLPIRDGSTSFCPHCGAPQLYLREHLLEDAPALETTGALPPPDMRRVDWQPALRAAIFVALVAPALCVLGSAMGIFSPLALLWILCGSIIAVGIYHKQRPLAYMDAGTGARIGIVVGIFMASILGVTLAVAGLVNRFALRSMQPFDTEMTTRLRTQIDLMVAQAAHTTPPTPVPTWLVATFLSPEFRAGIGLVSLGMFAAMLLTVSILGGAFAGLMRARPRLPA